MATYVISDIHGQLEPFLKLLEETSMDLEKDHLYLLGDYVDWGKDSVPTLLYVKQLDETYENVHVLMGNHDLMFLDTIRSFKEDGTLDANWLQNNCGLDTFKQYLKSSRAVRDEIESYLDSLPYRFDIDVNGKKYLLAHACPTDYFVYDYTLSKSENDRILHDLRCEAVWTRIISKTDDVIQSYSSEFDQFVCGHTINENFRINYRKGFIDIDCGAKVIGNSLFMQEPEGKLACLRLDDMKEYYAR